VLLAEKLISRFTKLYAQIEQGTLGFIRDIEASEEH
jgi:hypothetical protein